MENCLQKHLELQEKDTARLSMSYTVNRGPLILVAGPGELPTAQKKSADSSTCCEAFHPSGITSIHEGVASFKIVSCISSSPLQMSFQRSGALDVFVSINSLQANQPSKMTTPFTPVTIWKQANAALLLLGDNSRRPFVVIIVLSGPVEQVNLYSKFIQNGLI